MKFQDYRRLLVTYLRPHWPVVLLQLGLLLGVVGLQLVSPLILRHFIDSATAGKSMHLLTNIALWYLAVAVAVQCVGIAETYVVTHLSWTVTNQMRLDLIKHCLGLDMGFHKTHLPGEMIERVDGDVGQLASFLSNFTTNLLSNALMLLGMMVILLLTDWRIGLALVALAALSVPIVGPVQRLVVPYWTQVLQASADQFGFLEERLNGVEDIRCNGATRYAQGRLRTLLLSFRRIGRKTDVANNLTWAMGVVMFFSAHALVIGIGSFLFYAKAISIGTVYLVFRYALQVTGPMNRIMGQFQALQSATASLMRVRELLETKSAIEDGPGHHLEPGPALVEFDHVFFGYGEATSVLKDVTFRLRPGRVLGLLGRTGSGKSTLVRLLSRLYDPSAGVVRLQGVDIRLLKLDDLRGRIGMVTQDTQLFNASVRDNITFFDENVPDEKITEVLEQLGLAAWLHSLPDGLSTELSAGGSLSAGEGQMLAMARVFLKNPDVIILDEASSRLDPMTERLMGRAVDKLLANRTAIVIAHRLATVRHVDEIMILDDGRICEYGERQALEQDPNSRFNRLLRSSQEYSIL